MQSRGMTLVAMAAGIMAAGASIRPSSEADWDDPLGLRKGGEPRDSYGSEPTPLPRREYRKPGTSRYTPHVGAKQQAKGLKALERQRAKGVVA